MSHRTVKIITEKKSTNNEEVMLVGILICNHIYGEDWSFAIH